LPFLTSVEDLVFLVEDVRAGLAVERCVVVGHSLGGAIAMQYARDFPQRCHAAVAASAGPEFIIDLERVATLETDWESSIEHFARGQVSPNANPEVLEKARALVRARNPKALAQDLGICKTFSARKWLGTVTTPVLVVCAYEDRLTPLDGSLVLAQQIASAALTVISPGGHSLMLEHPVRFARAIDAFIESLRIS
jgi:4,5:9,10-diseco-3-hydroxy-5,9,17-trioxoandrosta-1(10),2-diene-4-oate hydrolase